MRPLARMIVRRRQAQWSATHAQVQQHMEQLRGQISGLQQMASAAASQAANPVAGQADWLARSKGLAAAAERHLASMAAGLEGMAAHQRALCDDLKEQREDADAVQQEEEARCAQLQARCQQLQQALDAAAQQRSRLSEQLQQSAAAAARQRTLVYSQLQQGLNAAAEQRRLISDQLQQAQAAVASAELIRNAALQDQAKLAQGKRAAEASAAAAELVATARGLRMEEGGTDAVELEGKFVVGWRAAMLRALGRGAGTCPGCCHAVGRAACSQSQKVPGKLLCVMLLAATAGW